MGICRRQLLAGVKYGERIDKRFNFETTLNAFQVFVPLVQAAACPSPWAIRTDISRENVSLLGKRPNLNTAKAIERGSERSRVVRTETDENFYVQGVTGRAGTCEARSERASRREETDGAWVLSKSLRIARGCWDLLADIEAFFTFQRI